MKILPHAVTAGARTTANGNSPNALANPGHRHPFAPEPDYPQDCRLCQLPDGNRRHRPPPAGAALDEHLAEGRHARDVQGWQQWETARFTRPNAASALSTVPIPEETR